ncbi:MAG TPA: flagellar M-ring protein FliF C-terminal domain-containing protein, partial [Bryobacteraceae bacterium]|nr:flagellar M-ring protein FliF C-terminal domain-containing protein [Bryobacteraceae bacterium]
NLVAGAVEGLSPTGVAIIDSNGRLLNRPREPGDSDAQLADANLDYRRQIESEMLARVDTALEPLLGRDRFRASVNVDCDFTTSEENDESYDPVKSAVLTSQTTEESSGTGTAGGTPGTATNLPRPAARATTTGSGIMRRSENLTYQPSHTVRHSVTPRGSIRRVSTAVLVDQTVHWNGVGPRARKTLVPPSPDVLKGVHDIVAGITGFDAQRGDQITVETLPFEATLEAEPPTGPAPAKPRPAPFDFKQPAVIASAVLLVILGAGTFFLLSSRRRTGKVEDGAPTAIPASPAAAGEGLDSKARMMEQQIAENEARLSQIEAEEMSRIKLPPSTRKTEVLVRHIRDSVHKDSVKATSVLRSWISEPGAKHSS